MKVILLTLMLAGTAEDKDYTKQVETVCEEAVTIFEHVTSFGEEVWKRLSSEQGRRIVHRIRSLTTTLIVSNTALIDEMKSSVAQGTQKELPIAKRIADLKEQVNKINETIGKFYQEIDDTSRGATDDRGKMAEAGMAKPAVLITVESYWTRGHYDDAISKLEEGKTVVERLGKVSACLDETAERKVLACDSEFRLLPK